MEKVYIIARFVAKPGKIDELRPILHAMLAPTHAEAGCEKYELFESTEGGRFFFDEIWSSRTELEAHAASPHLQNLLVVTKDLVSESPEINFLRPIAK